MSLKLSSDPKRLLSYIGNALLADKIFISLLPLFDWAGESLFENDDNRDVSAAITRRFYANVQRNHNVEYSPVGIFQTAVNSDNEDLLATLLHLQPIRSAFNQDSKSIEHQVLQALSRNPMSSAKTLASLAKSDDGRLSYYLAGNPNIDSQTVDILIQSEDSDVLSELAQSKALNSKHYDIFLANNDRFINEILEFLPLKE